MLSFNSSSLNLIIFHSANDTASVLLCVPLFKCWYHSVLPFVRIRVSLFICYSALTQRSWQRDMNDKESFELCLSEVHETSVKIITSFKFCIFGKHFIWDPLPAVSVQDFLDDDVQYNFVRHFYTRRDQAYFLAHFVVTTWPHVHWRLPFATLSTCLRPYPSHTLCYSQEARCFLVLTRQRKRKKRKRKTARWLKAKNRNLSSQRSPATTCGRQAACSCSLLLSLVFVSGT